MNVMYFSINDTGTPTGVEPTTFRLANTDALPLSYRRLVGAKAIKLGSADKHPA